MSQMLEPLLDQRAAGRVAGSTDGVLYAYPLLGVRFEVATGRRRGELMHVVVDNQTGYAQTSDPWHLVPIPAHARIQSVRALPEADLVAKAREVARLRLPRLVPVELTTLSPVELYKPNWFFETPRGRILVDGMTGEFVIA